MTSKQNQKAGENSQQFQANQMVVNFGIDEKRAREIYQEMNLQVRKDYSNEAMNIAISRVTEFESKLMPKMEKVEGALEVFADPSFQLLLVEAQKAAASTERPADYDLLSELLLHRFQAGENRITRAGINRAVEIVGEVSDEALLGLTIYHGVSSLAPNTNNIFEALDILEELFKKIIYCDLPSGHDWIDHLEILNAIRINSLMQLSKIEQLYVNCLSDCIDPGIAKDSENFIQAKNIIRENNLPQDLLVDDVIDNNFVRLNILKKDIDTLCLIENYGTPYARQFPLSEAQKQAITQIYQLYNQDPQQKEKNIVIFMNEWNTRPSLKKLKDWWDNLNVSFTTTSVGRVLAHSNIQRCDNRVPNFNTLNR